MTESSNAAPRIWVDADACPGPIKEILFRAAERARVQVTLVANQWLSTPTSRHISALQVQGGFDAADDLIAERAPPGRPRRHPGHSPRRPRTGKRRRSRQPPRRALHPRQHRRTPFRAELHGRTPRRRRTDRRSLRLQRPRPTVVCESAGWVVGAAGVGLPPTCVRLQGHEQLYQLYSESELSGQPPSACSD